MSKSELFAGKHKDNSRIKGVLREWKELKRVEAKQRQENYLKLTIQQKIDKLNRDSFVARKQRVKLFKQLNGEK